MTGNAVATPIAFPRLRAMILCLRWPLLLLGGLLLGFTVIFPQIGLAEWIALMPALAVLFVVAADPAVKLRRLYGMGLGFFLSFLLVTFHWFLYMYPLDFAGMSRPASAVVVTVAWIGLSLFQALGAALLFPLFAIAVRGKWLSRYPILHPVLIAALWTSLEWWWAHSGWSGVPWSRLCLGQAHLLPILQSASVFGSYFVTFLIVAVNGLLAYLILYPTRRILCAALAGGLFLGNIGFGVVRMATYEPTGKTLTVAAIQGNKSSLDYWGYETMDEVMDTYERLTREAVAAGADVVVWPETGVPANVDRDRYTRAYLTELSRTCGVPILAGVFTQVSEDSDQDYNSIVVALPDGTLHDTVYNKRNPVPFGEFVPFRDLVMTLLPPLAEINTLGEDIPAGVDSEVFHLEEGSIGALICFDSIYESNALDSVADGAELLAVSTNDSWFRDSRGVWMHHAQSRLRAIETGRYVARSAVTGVSSIITPTGKAMATLDALEQGYVLEEVYLTTTKTPYRVIGDVFAYVALAASAVSILLPLIDGVVNVIASRQKKQNQKTKP